MLEAELRRLREDASEDNRQKESLQLQVMTMLLLMVVVMAAAVADGGGDGSGGDALRCSLRTLKTSLRCGKAPWSPTSRSWHS